MNNHVIRKKNAVLDPVLEISSTECLQDVTLLPGEKIDTDINEREVTLCCPYEGEIRGHLFLTNFRLYFKPDNEKDTPKGKIVQVPLCSINKIEKFGGANTKGAYGYGINIICKDIRTLKFAHSTENHSRRDVFEKLKQYAFPLTYNSGKKLFCFEFKQTFPIDGWSVFEPMTEFKRMNLPNESWKITKINDKYKLCDTYPAILVVPQAATDSDLNAVAAFRSRQRLPVLSWIHQESQASIVRCSQPLTGISGQRCAEDEKYIQMIMDANAQSHKIFIMDARPQTNAMANRTRGGGLENEHLYNNAEIQFLGIASIHPMRESLRKLSELCFPGTIDDSQFMTELDKTQWLKHIQVILSGAVRVVDKIEYQKTSVVVHCSDGWDRTSQLTSLAMLMLDPHYRTLEGFQVLIEKEWLSFGHKFAQRLGHGEDKASDDNRSPVFLQWLDCVWQMQRQFPTAFEFNETLLIFIADHMYSCLFGTFLANSELVRKRDGIPHKTKSIWSMVNSSKENFLNACYTAATTPYTISIAASPSRDYVIVPRCGAPFIQLWTAYFCRWNINIAPQSVHQIQLRNIELLAIRGTLQKKAEELQKKLQSKYSRQSNAVSNAHNSSGPSSPNNSQLTNTNPNARVVNV